MDGWRKDQLAADFSCSNEEGPPLVDAAESSLWDFGVLEDESVKDAFRTCDDCCGNSNIGALPNEMSRRETRVCSTRTNKPGLSQPCKKRRRRQKEELVLLRMTVTSLEIELQRVRVQRINQVRLHRAVQQERNQTSMHKTESVWEQQAATAKAGMQHALVENVKLRAVLESLSNTATNLETMLRTRPLVKIPPLCTSLLASNSTIPLTGDGEAEVFKSIGSGLDAQYAETDVILSSSTSCHADKVSGVTVLTDGPDVCLAFKHSRLFPFVWQACSHAMWEMLSQQSMQVDSMLLVNRERKFNEIRGKIVDSTVFGKEHNTTKVLMAMKRFLEEHRDVLVWEIIVETVGSVSLKARGKLWLVLHGLDHDNDTVDPLVSNASGRWELHGRVYPESTTDSLTRDAENVAKLVSLVCKYLAEIMEQGMQRTIFGDDIQHS